MFTGIISGVGRVSEVQPIGAGADMRLRITVPQDKEVWAGLPGVILGASISCSGCCLTVVEMDAASFAVEVSAETLSKTTLGGWGIGRAHQSGTRPEGRGRTRRPYGLGSCRRARHGRLRDAGEWLHPLDLPGAEDPCALHRA